MLAWRTRRTYTTCIGTEFLHRIRDDTVESTVGEGLTSSLMKIGERIKSPGRMKRHYVKPLDPVESPELPFGRLIGTVLRVDSQFADETPAPQLSPSCGTYLRGAAMS